MIRNLVVVTMLLGALAACNRDEAKPAPIPPVIAPAVTAETAPAVIPSVPADIATAPPRKRTAREPAKPAEGRRPGDDGGFAPVQEEPDMGQSEGTYDENADGAEVADPVDRVPRAVTGNWRGLGEFEFGEGVEEIREAWPGELEGDESDECFYLSTEGGRPSAQPSLMFERGRLVRYDVDSPALSAPGGGRVGMDVEEILDRYGGEVERQPHKYGDGEYLRVENGDSVLLFETDEDGVVTEWRVGLPPQVDYVEGCS